MPIKIIDVPDAFSAASRLAAEPPPLIESDAYRQLLHELRRYCRGELTGRSFLVAGHRGAGKTTLVSSAFEALLREQDRQADVSVPSDDAARISLRVLPVLLQGPTLLPNSQEDLPLAMDGTGEAGRRLTPMENVLVQITLGLHRAVAREMVLAFRAHVHKNTPHATLDRRDMRELAAQLELELGDYAGQARLREIWRRCGALDHGVLYALASTPFMLHDEVRLHRLLRSAVAQTRWDQGLRELVALASVCDAYRRISGKISRKDELKAGAAIRAERSLEIEAKGKDLIAPLLALLTGGAVGAGTLAAGASAPVAGLAGVLTAFAGTLAGKRSFTRTRDRSASLEDLFIPDLSVATLDRILPVLLDRLRDAGLAPVFVVDELDKVEDLSTRILDMIRRLKKLVAENACFCFLADRSYFEEMRCRTAVAPYSIEHTYFTHQFFISFRHVDVRRYLEQILARPVVDSGDPNALDRYKEEEADRALLPFILMHGSQMHPIDLQRQLTEWRDADGNLILGHGVVRSKRRYQLELLVQLAIELQLEQEAMQEELDRRPAFRRLAHDALYFISREWEKDNETLNLADEAERQFEKYLIDRMALEWTRRPRTEASPPASSSAASTAGQERTEIPAAATPKANTAPGEGAAGVTSAEPRKRDGARDVPPVNGEDLNFLWKAVQALGESLASPGIVQAEYEKRKANEVVVSALREAVKLGPLFEPDEWGLPGVYRWRFRRSGRLVRQPAPAAPASVAAVGAAAGEPAVVGVGEAATAVPQAPALWLSQIATIRHFERVLEEVTQKTVDPSTLSAGVGVLPTSPAWPQVCTALSRLESLSPERTSYPELEEDVSVVGAYARLLDTNAPAVALSLYCAAVLANWSKAQQPQRDALEKMSEVLGLRDIGPGPVVDQLSRIGAELMRGTPAPQPLPDDKAETAEWLSWMASLAGGLAISNPQLGATNAAWEYCRLLLRRNAPPATVEVLRLAVAAAGPFALVKLPVDGMTLRDWSLAFFEAIRMKDPSPPPWLATAALRALGWEERLDALMMMATDGRLFADQKTPLPGDTEPALAGRPRSQRLGPRVVLVTRAGGISESWKPDRSSAALALRPDEWSEITRIWGKQREGLSRALRPELGVVDQSGDAPLVQSGYRRREVDYGLTGKEQQIVDFFWPDERGSSAIVLIRSEPPGADIAMRFRFVVRPKSLADVVRGQAASMA